MPIYTLSLGLDPPQTFTITAHNDAGAFVLAKEQVEHEVWARSRELNGNTTVGISSETDGAMIYESTVGSMLKSDRGRALQQTPPKP